MQDEIRTVAGQLTGAPTTAGPYGDDSLTRAYRVIFAAAARDRAMSAWLPRFVDKLRARAADRAGGAP